jgi:YD repeat-containing protein
MGKDRKIEVTMKRLVHLLGLICGLLLFQASKAEVNPRNGNFAVTYTLSSDQQRATYNSKSTDRGWFGFGWGSDFETRLLVMTDGSAVVLENGTGAQTVYGRKIGSSPQQQLVQQMLDDILVVEKLDPYQVAELRRELDSADGRISKLKTYGMSGKVPLGAVLKGEGCDEAQLSKTSDGYARRRCDGQLDQFDSRGWLLRRTSSDGKVSSAIYENSPYPKALIESDGSRVEFHWSNRGQMVKQTRIDREGKSATVLFAYDLRGNLARMDYTSGPHGGSHNRFRYDDRQNLIEVRYLDESTMLIAYDQQDQAIEVTDRSGKRTTYEYSTDPVTKEDITVIVASSQQANEKRRVLRFASDGLPTRTEDAQGRWTEYTYHPILRKVTQMRNAAGARRFTYDVEGRVLSASEGERGANVRFTYDKDGRISNIFSTDSEGQHRVLDFSYNANNKPVVIKLEGVGRIDIRYSAAGEIESVNSPAGAKIALAVTHAFQSVLELVKMSGATLGL